MQCPIDGETLLMSQRNGVEIDYCPKCRGVWLDRGELDKILERASAEAAPAANPRGDDRRQEGRSQEDRRQEDRREDRRNDYRSDDRHTSDRREDYDGRSHDGHGHKKRRESFLSDLFDF